MTPKEQTLTCYQIMVRGAAWSIFICTGGHPYPLLLALVIIMSNEATPKTLVRHPLMPQWVHNLLRWGFPFVFLLCKQWTSGRSTRTRRNPRTLLPSTSASTFTQLATKKLTISYCLLIRGNVEHTNPYWNRVHVTLGWLCFFVEWPNN